VVRREGIGGCPSRIRTSVAALMASGPSRRRPQLGHKGELLVQAHPTAGPRATIIGHPDIDSASVCLDEFNGDWVLFRNWAIW
jgi:hypothetical protein